MPRKPRINVEQGYYHIISRGNQYQNIFKIDDDRIRFLNNLEKYSSIFKYKVHCYCLMSNHFHLLIQTELANLSNIMQRLLSAYTLYYNARHNLAGHLFQGRFKSQLIEKENYLLELSRYIHLNAVRANIVKKPEDYKWSSLHSYLKNPHDDFIYIKDVMTYFNNNKNNYLQFLYQGNKNELYKDINKTPYLGSMDFIKKMEKKEEIAELKVSKNQELELSKNEIIRKVCQYYNVSHKNLNKIKRRDKNISSLRKIIAYLLRQKTTLTLEEIGDILGGVSPQSINNILNRIDDDLKKVALEIIS